MTKNPFFNALAAFAYIVGLVFFLSKVLFVKSDAQLGIFAPMIMLSLFVLSTAVMGYLFLYEPGQLYFESKRDEALRLFAQTVLTFALLTAGLLFLVTFI